ncbi:MAG: serine hydrolase [Aminipila sp.]
MKLKKVFTVFMGLLLCGSILIWPVGIYADTDTDANSVKIFTNGNELSLRQMPVMEKERMLVPYKEIAKALGAEATWNETKKMVTIIKGNKTLMFTIADQYAIVNGNKMTLDIPATMVNDNVYIPVRFICENLGYKVNWDNQQNTMYIDMPISDKEAATKIEEYMDIYGDSGMFSGDLLVMRNEKVIIQKSYGLANQELNVLNTNETKYRIGSMTKAFTAALIMQLQEKGKLNADDYVSKYLPDYPKGNQITINNLLTHTSGIPDFLNSPEFIGNSPMTPEELISYFKNMPLDCKPGTQFEYSNSNYMLLGYIIEKITGKSYETVLENNILTPLGMKDSGYVHNETIIKNLACGYSTSNDILSNPAYYDTSTIYAAGAMYSTLADLYKWDRALYEGKLLKKESTQKMFTPYLDNYGYGWSIEQLYGRQLIWHDGSVPGFSSIILRYPSENICIIMLENNRRFIPERASRDISAILFGEKYENPKLFIEKKLNQNEILQLVGKYHTNPDSSINVYEKDNKIYMDASSYSSSPMVLHPQSGTEFYTKDSDIRFVFTKNSSGKINGIDIDQFGFVKHAQKAN